MQSLLLLLLIVSNAFMESPQLKVFLIKMIQLYLHHNFYFDNLQTLQPKLSQILQRQFQHRLFNY